MSNFAATPSTLIEIESWYEGGQANKRVGCRKLTIVLTGQGTTTNKITAASLGFEKIDSAGPFVADGDDHIYVASPSYDGSLLLLKASATDAPADITDTLRGIVRGT